jgi:hypothetical protein
MPNGTLSFFFFLHFSSFSSFSYCLSFLTRSMKLLELKKSCTYNRQVDALARHPDLFPGGYHEV